MHSANEARTCRVLSKNRCISLIWTDLCSEHAGQHQCWLLIHSRNRSAVDGGQKKRMRRRIQVWHFRDMLDASRQLVGRGHYVSRTRMQKVVSQMASRVGQPGNDPKCPLERTQGDTGEMDCEVQRGACDVLWLTETDLETERTGELLRAGFLRIDEPTATHVEGQRILVISSLHVAIRLLKLDDRIFIRHANQKESGTSQSRLQSRNRTDDAIKWM